jgi:hypothetical protein
MATVTPNFDFPIPQSTDLVKDGATAIAALGTAIDTDFVDLKGGTTGQVLAKASGTDLDFSWVAQDDSNAIQNAIVDAKGDLIAATAADTPARLGVGADFAFLGALASESTGLKWNKTFTNYTPLFTGFGGTPPSLGNGTIGGNYLRIGNLVYFTASLTFGSTSTYGSGGSAFAISLPFTSSQALRFGQAVILDSGVAWYRNFQCESLSQGSGTYFSISSGATNQVTATSPFTFGTADAIYCAGIYEVV